MSKFGQIDNCLRVAAAFRGKLCLPEAFRRNARSGSMEMTTDYSQLSTAVNRDGAVILNTTEGRITTLNATGAYVWQALERGETLEMIASNLARETGELVEIVNKDVENFLNDLRAHKLLSL
jgi:hypothetical protein